MHYCDARSPWHDENSPSSYAYDTHLLLQLVNSTMEDVSIKEGLSYDIVRAHGRPIATAGGEFLERVTGFTRFPDRKIAGGTGENEATRVSRDSLHNDVRFVAGAREFFKFLAGIDLGVIRAEFCGLRTKRQNDQKNERFHWLKIL